MMQNLVLEGVYVGRCNITTTAGLINKINKII
jgi:hypothetical protein